MIILVLLVLPVPIKIFNSNFFDLLFSAPSKQVIDVVKKRIESELSTLSDFDYFFRTAKYGRFYNIHISILQGNNGSFTTQDMDTVRTKLNSSINKEIPNSIITIETTSDKILYQKINEQ